MAARTAEADSEAAHAKAPVKDVTQRHPFNYQDNTQLVLELPDGVAHTVRVA